LFTQDFHASVITMIGNSKAVLLVINKAYINKYNYMRIHLSDYLKSNWLTKHNNSAILAEVAS